MIFLLFPAVAAGISAFCAQARESKKRTEILTAIYETMAMAELAPDRPVAGGGTAHAAAERLEDQSMEVVSALHWWGRKGA
jgi:hypothetical protein